jgi:hypothetical protein
MAAVWGLSGGSGYGAGAALAATPCCWKAELRVVTTLPNSTTPITLVYEVLQNSEGMVRQELRRMEPNLSAVGGGRDVQILDYKQGTALAFDKGGPSALRRPLSDPDIDPDVFSSESMSTREILGHRCQGSMGRKEDPKTGWTRTRETWVAADLGFHLPLLEIVQDFDSKRALNSTSVRTVTSIERIDRVDDSLFRVPEGYRVQELGTLPR